LAFIDLRPLSEPEVAAFVVDGFSEAVAAVGYADDEVAVKTAAESRSGYESAQVVIRKVLSPNDLGETGSHQSAIVVPASEASRIAVLDEDVENPSTTLVVRHGETDEASVWRLIHYNGRVHGHSTRDEYRLTGTTAFLRQFRASVGDQLVLSRDGSGGFTAWVVRE
jgi:hypothetical protein